MIDFSGCAQSMNPPWAFCVGIAAVELIRAEVCLNEAKEDPVWMSWSVMDPGPEEGVLGEVEQRMISWKYIFVEASFKGRW